MKKSALFACALALLGLSSCTSSSSLLGNAGSSVLGSVLGGTTGSTSTATTSSTGSILSNVLSSVLGSGSVSQSELIGTWTYTGSDCVFESDNLLKKAGGAVAASKIKSELNQNLQKIGIKEGSTSFTFNSDNTFKANLGGKSMSGTYVLDESNQKITLKLGTLGLGTLKGNVAKSGGKLSLLFDSDKLLKVASVVGSLSGNTAIKALSSLAGSYDGMMVGMQFKK